MSEIQIGKTLTTSLGDTIVIEKNGKDAILYRKGEVENQYIYAHNIELDESKNKYVWSGGEYYSSLSDCMVNVIASQKESFYELIDNAHKLHHSNYIKGIVRAETEVFDENFLESIYEKYLDSESIDDIFCDDFKKLLTNDMEVELDKENQELKYPFRLVENTEEQVILENLIKDPLSAAKFPYVSINNKYYTITKGENHTMTSIRENGEKGISFSWGYGGTTLIGESLQRLKKEAASYVETECGIALNVKTVEKPAASLFYNRDSETWKLKLSYPNNEVAFIPSLKNISKEEAEEFADKINNVKEITYSVNDFKDRENPIAAKLEFEYEAYKNDLKNKDVEYIIDRSFETYYKDNIVIAADNMDFSEEDEEVLLNKENLLEELYDDWLDCDFDEMEGYLNSVAESKDKIMQHHMNKYVDKNKEAGYEPEM